MRSQKFRELLTSPLLIFPACILFLILTVNTLRHRGGKGGTPAGEEKRS